MKLSTPQLKIVIYSIQHLIQCEDKRMGALEKVQGGVIFGYYQLARMTRNEVEIKELHCLADKDETWLDSKLEDWTYQKYYLKQFLGYLQNNYRNKLKLGGGCATAS